jgi:hypothetical protein
LALVPRERQRDRAQGERGLEGAKVQPRAEPANDALGRSEDHVRLRNGDRSRDEIRHAKRDVAANGINAVTRVTMTGEATVVAIRGPLDFPASIAVAGANAEKKLYVTNAALKSAQTPGATPKPGLLVLPFLH